MKIVCWNVLNILWLIETAVADQILHCENHETMAMLNPMLEDPGFMVIMLHWLQKGKFHAGVCVCLLCGSPHHV